MRIFLKILLLLVPGLIIINNDCNAFKVKGYIVNLNQDTIYGIILLHRYDQVTGALCLNGFDTESLYCNVVFKGNTSKSFQTLTPDKIISFGFEYDSNNYAYKSFLLKHNSIIKKEREEFRFLNLIYKGNLHLYRNVRCLYIPSNNRLDSYPVYYEYFLFSDSGGLLKVEKNDQTGTVQDLLRQSGIKEEFIKELPRNIKFDDIEAVLENYDKWLSAHYSNITAYAS